ncbi:hypothetical protein MLD38_005186 [Melastoma candidum]|uniref:Uncharacterized protein n=1 Tax=Melastoma candidum TaxID=119954 RepID=A0ACB9S9C5_9MYRT|nr:hypothetical protein MLD38_005186 [Melastoma candidum]
MPASVDGLSSLFSSPGPMLAKGSPSAGFGDELCGSMIDKGEEFQELGCSFRYSRMSRAAAASYVDVEVEDEPISINGVYGGVGAYGVNMDELTFDLEDSFVKSDVEPYVKELLAGAQLRHKIFCDEFVVKAFFEAEKAHRGQLRASGDPYLQHCVETAVLLALIGANSTVVAAGLLHDTLDDTFISNDYLLRTFGVGVANLV